jgi:hypothetical protein
MPDGRHTVLATIACARDEGHEIAGLVIALIDITRYK